MSFKKILSDNNYYFNDLKFSELSKSLILKDKNNIKDIFTDIENIKNHYKLKELEAMKLLYFNINIIHPLLYEFDNIIKINSIEKVDNIPYYYYLSLLITNNPNVIYYYFNIQFIRNINESNINKENNIKKIIISKIIFDIIKYYRGLEEFGNNLEEIKKIEEENHKVMENNKNILYEFNLSIKEIKSKTIDEIYLEIIISLIKNKFEDYKYIENKIKQLDFESINITQIMFNKIKSLLDNKESDINKYLRSKNKDLFDKIINLFYILLKYIFKERNYIYQLNFFLDERESIKKLINSNNDYFESFKKDNKERLDYIIKIIADNDVKNNNQKISYSNEKSNQQSNNNAINSTESATIENKEEKYKFFFPKLIKIIGNHKRKKNQSNTEKEYTADFVIETSKFFISGGSNNEIIIYSKDSSFIKINNPYFPDDWVYNILEKEENHLLVTQGKKLDLVKVITDNNNSTIYTKLDKNLLFTLKNGQNYIICCHDKVLIYDSNLIERNNFAEGKILLDNYTSKAAIKINNLVLLKSNKICSMGSDHLIIYSLISYKQIYNKLDEYSFVYSQNGLTLLPINIKDEKNSQIINKKLLLCACKKYIKSQRNGILLIMNFEDINIKTFFLDTRNFEVYCFCPILIYETNNILEINNTNTNYFLAGGFEKEKNKGIIKLYKIIYSYEKSESRIEFIHNIEIINQYDSNEFIILKKPISCIIQTSSDEHLLVTCWDGNVYLLTTSNIEVCLKFDKLIEKNISIKDFENFHFLDK